MHNENSTKTVTLNKVEKRTSRSVILPKISRTYRCTSDDLEWSRFRMFSAYNWGIRYFNLWQIKTVLSNKKNESKRFLHDRNPTTRHDKKLSRKRIHSQEHNPINFLFRQSLKSSQTVCKWPSSHEKI